MTDTLIIVGAGGHARVCAEIALLTGYEKIIYLDDNKDLFGKEIYKGMILLLIFMSLIMLQFISKSITVLFLIS